MPKSASDDVRCFVQNAGSGCIQSRHRPSYFGVNSLRNESSQNTISVFSRQIVGSHRELGEANALKIAQMIKGICELKKVPYSDRYPRILKTLPRPTADFTTK